VTLISGPTNLQTPHRSINLVKVETAQEMLDATQGYFSQSDVIIFSAAVADYQSREVAEQKIKKKSSEMVLELVKTPDIAGTLGNIKKSNQLVIGFALETENELEHAQEKLERKGFDYVILNSLNDPGAGFAHDTNKITVIDKEKTIRRFELKPKDEVAADILNIVLEKWSQV
jgi:phosphopantothenoylcysteine decarboxylase/phosphopantothenate--cysteine ligase